MPRQTSQGAVGKQTDKELLQILEDVVLKGKTPEEAGYNAYKVKPKK